MTCVNKSAGQETFACTIHQIFIKGNKSHKKNDFGIIFSKELTFLAKISLYKAGPRHCWHRNLTVCYWLTAILQFALGLKA